MYQQNCLLVVLVNRVFDHRFSVLKWGVAFSNVRSDLNCWLKCTVPKFCLGKLAMQKVHVAYY